MVSFFNHFVQQTVNVLLTSQNSSPQVLEREEAYNLNNTFTQQVTYARVRLERHSEFDF